VRVHRDGAYAAAALDAELDRALQLDERDRALATALAYGALRYGKWLEESLGRHATRGLNRLDAHAHAHLVVAAYQLLVLTRIPPFAAVNEAVTAIREKRGDRVSAFANAVLRKIAGEPKPTAEDLVHAVLASIDPWLARAIERAVGRQPALALLGVGEEAPPIGLRVEDPTQRETWLTKLRAARPDVRFEAGRVSPHAILGRGAGRIVDLPGYPEGAWTPQEEGSQVVALALGANAGDTILDACAGRGNKTGLLARAVKSGSVDAADLHAKKLERLREELSRIGVAPRETAAVDWSVGPGLLRGPYDRVLVDAPCSGTGTLRRRPEILLRRCEKDVVELVRLQRDIVTRAAALVRPGGRLVYAVCSVLVEEAEAVVASVLATPDLGLSAAPFDAPAISRMKPNAASLRLLPHEHGTDGYFIASFVKK